MHLRAAGDSVRLMTFLGVLLALLIGGCTSRQRLSVPYPSTLPPDQEVEVWQASSRTVLRHVSFDSGIVRGYQGTFRPACDSCWVVIPRVRADSVVLVNRDLTYAAVGIVGLLTFWVLDHCWPYRACS
jgi:hypothetical protein